MLTGLKDRVRKAADALRGREAPREDPEPAGTVRFDQDDDRRTRPRFDQDERE